MIVNSDTAGINDLRARLMAMRNEIATLAVETGQIIGDTVAQQLGDAAPRGTSEGSAIGDDASGSLSESFSADVEEQGEGALVTVSTSQGNKLGFVVNGRGDIYPVNKRALYWVGLDHPVKHAGPSQPNDFISGIIDSVSDIIEPEMNAMVDELNAILEGA